MRLRVPSTGTVLGALALFVALGGTALALTKNSVGTKQLKPSAVRASDLAKNAVTSPKVKDGSLLLQDFASGQIPTGATGPTGAAGTARASMFLNPGGCPGALSTCEPILPKGIASVRRVATGTYCVNVPGVDSRQNIAIAQASYQFTTAPSNAAAASWIYYADPTFAGCTSTEFVVQTLKLDETTARNFNDTGTVGVLANTQALSSSVGFLFLVP